MILESNQDLTNYYLLYDKTNVEFSGIFFSILRKFRLSQQILIKGSEIKFRGPSRGRATICGHTDIQSDRQTHGRKGGRTSMKKEFSQVCESVERNVSLNS